jgi:hypothetical protein
MVPATEGRRDVPFGEAFAMDRVRRETGKQSINSVSDSRVTQISVPSGKVDKRVEGIYGPPASSATNRVDVLRRLSSARLMFYPSGAAELNPAHVIASKPAQLYEVLPQEAGLQQLLKEGALSRSDRGELVINRRIRFPAELTEDHAFTFLLPRGAARPDGDPGDSCVMVEETGLTLQGKPACQ